MTYIHQDETYDWLIHNGPEEEWHKKHDSFAYIPDELGAELAAAWQQLYKVTEKIDNLLALKRGEERRP
jgi:hypothetical protein